MAPAAPLLPTAAPATVPAPPIPLLARGTSSIETTVLFGLALEAVAAPLAEAPCALPLAVSEVLAAPPSVVLAVPELLDWS